MNARSRVLLASIFLLLVLVVAFAVVDFHALESRTDADSSVGTSRTNDATAPRGEPLQVLVKGDGPVAASLGDQLETSLSSSFDAVTHSGDAIEDWDGPVLVVVVEETTLRYNPVTPSAAVTASFAFVGGGNATLATGYLDGSEPVVLSDRNPYVVTGEVSMTDRSRGVASRPGYHGLVTERLAERLADALTSAPGMD